MAGLIGTSIHELDTPALLVNGPMMERNLRRMADFFREGPAKLRPHFKNHKCTTLAKCQLDAGSAVGITCAKLAEAEILARAGVTNILIANQIVGTAKIQRLMDLAPNAETLRVAIDHLDHAHALSEAARRTGVTLGILIEVDIGMNRCGVEPGQPAIDLAQQVMRLPGLRFDGLQAYEGHLVDVPDVDEREQRTQACMNLAVTTRQQLNDASIEVAVISGGSTSTYAITGRIDGIDEIQAGTYPTMDVMYRRLTPEFELALSVLARVISRPRPGVAVLDVGLKGVGHEFGPPIPRSLLDTDVNTSLAEEHCIVRGQLDWHIGDAIELIPSHACTTCNLHPRLILHDNDHVTDIWPIEASRAMT